MSYPVSTRVTVQGSANSLESCSGQARSEVTDMREQEKEKLNGLWMDTQCWPGFWAAERKQNPLIHSATDGKQKYSQVAALTKQM